MNRARNVAPYAGPRKLEVVKPRGPRVKKYMRPIKAVDAIPPQARREYHRSLLSWLPDGAEAAELRGDQVAQRVMLAYRRHYHRPSDEAWREFLAACEEYRRG